jgi:hypothetical protein
MYNFQECAEITKETIEPDDVAAICGVYPLANDPGTCDHVEEPGGCLNSVGGGHGGGLVLLVGLILTIRFWRRRR